MRSFLGTLTAVVLFVAAPAGALAQETAPAGTAAAQPAPASIEPAVAPVAGAPDSTPAPDPSAKDGPRVRFGIAGAVAGGTASGTTPAGNDVSSGVVGPGLQLDLGVQIRRDVAIFLRAEAATVVFLSGASAYLVAEWTPVRYFSVGTGLGADTMTVLWVSADGSGKSIRNNWTGLSVPLVLGVQFIDKENWDEPRRKPALRLGLEFAAGVEPRSWVFGWHANLTIGFVLR